MKNRAEDYLKQLQLLEKQIMGEEPNYYEIEAFRSAIQKIWKEFCDGCDVDKLALNVNERRLENMYSTLSLIISK